MKPRKPDRWELRRRAELKRRFIKEHATVVQFRALLDERFPGLNERKVAVLDAVRALVRGA